MRVKVEGCESESVAVPSGVPQGSILGPSLFISFINALAELSLNTESSVILYADDVALIHPLLAEASIQHLQNDIDKIEECTKSLGLHLNIGKCQFVVFSLSKTPTKPITLTVNGQALKQVPSYRYLGVELEEKCSFARQTAIATMKAKQGIGAFNRMLRKWAPPDVLSTAITAIVLPALYYAIEVWYPPDECNQRKIEKVNKFTARLLLNDFQRDSTYEGLLSELNWKPITRLVCERRLLCVKRYVDNIRFLPNDIFTLQPTCITRQSQRIKAKQNKHTLQLAMSRESKNILEGKLAIERMKEVWNAMPENSIHLPFPIFRDHVRSDKLYEDLSSVMGTVKNV
jgi:hypothetical protein